MNRYRQYAPPAELASYVECFWSTVSTEVDFVPSVQRVLPDGCLDIIFHLHGRSHAVVVGAMTRPLLVPLQPRSQLVAVRFRPGGGFPFLRTPLAELADQHVGLEHWHRQQLLCEQLLELDSEEAQVRALAGWLLSQLAQLPQLDLRIHRAAQQLSRAQPPSIAQLALELGITRQHLTRQFNQQVGLGPKEFARVMRFRRVIDFIRQSNTVDGASLALESGFFDQAHLICDFKALSGLSPGAYVRSRSSIFPIQTSLLGLALGHAERSAGERADLRWRERTANRAAR